MPVGHNCIFSSAQLLTLTLVVSLPLASSLSEDVKAVPVLSFAVSKRISLLWFLVFF